MLPSEWMLRKPASRPSAVKWPHSAPASARPPQIGQGIVKQMIVARRLRGVFRRQRADGAGRDLGRRRLQVQQRLIGLLIVQAKFALHGVGGLVREDGEARVLRNGHAPQYAQQGARIRNAAEKAVSARLQQHALRSVVQRGSVRSGGAFP